MRPPTWRRSFGTLAAVGPLVVLHTSCGGGGRSPAGGDLDAIATAYVGLVLALGEHDADYVDAYYGPEEWRERARQEAATLRQIGERASAQIEAMATVATAEGDPLVGLRRLYLARQLEALAARVRMLEGDRFPFDEESRALYDAVAPTRDASTFRAALDQLDGRLPGAGTVLERWTAWRAQFTIPADRLDAVFTAAIDECRARTLSHVELPPGESFRVEYVQDESWSAYNWYQGGFESLIQVNTDLPIAIDRAIDLACHEGYPGHHVYNVLLEKHLVRDRGWVEFSVYPLFSPQSLIAEGTANYGIEVAFPGDERVHFERDVLFPLAGLDADRAEEYYAVLDLVDALGHAGNEAARRYLDGTADADEARNWLETYALMDPDRAAQRLRFIEQYRSYVINYNHGQDLVRRYVEAHGGTPEAPERRWQVFGELLASPRLPGGLAVDGRAQPSSGF